MSSGGKRKAELNGEQSTAKKVCNAANNLAVVAVSEAVVETTEQGVVEVMDLTSKFGKMWAIYKGVWTGRVLMKPKSRLRGVIEYPGLHFKDPHHAATYFIMWHGATESVEVSWKYVVQWMTHEFCTTSPWVLKSILAYQANNWHPLTAEGEKQFNLAKKKLCAARKLKQKIWRDDKNKAKSEKFREDPSTTLTPDGDFFYLLEHEAREAEAARILAARDPNEIIVKMKAAPRKRKSPEDAATPGTEVPAGGESGTDGGSSGGSAPAAPKRPKAAAKSKARSDGGEGVEVKVEKGTESAAADGAESADSGSEDAEVDEEDARREWTEVYWTGHKYPKELAFVPGDKTVAETLAEEASDRAAGKPETEFVVERIMDEMRVEVEGLKKPVKYFLVKWEGYELDVQSGLDSETFGGSWLTDGQLRGNKVAKAWKRSEPGWWLRQLK